MTHLRLWKFRPPADGDEAFAEAYGADGAWARLFALHPGYRGTTLARPTQPGGWWLTIDRWADEAAFEAILRDHGEAYRALDLQLEGIAGDEEFIGTFEDSSATE
ncbi:MAG: antibiotic biosynthesis monooxygenase family protein [Sphingomicrobium sp.]